MERIKELVVKMLNAAAYRYIRRNNIKVIAVAGSIGKTSTASAIRTVLSQKYRVHFPKTAYNDSKSVHLEMFDLRFASSLPGWIWMVARVLLKTLGKAKYEVLVMEIGTDHPGEMRRFAWLRPQIGVPTAIAPEHMELFKTIEAVAEEELVIAGYSEKLVLNKSTIDNRFVAPEIAGRATWYGDGTAYSAAHYKLQALQASADFRFGDYALPAQPLQVIGEHSLQALLAAGTVGVLCGLSAEEIRAGLQAFQPVAGRMKLLHGTQDAVIIDDSYNASPDAVKAALQTLYGLDAPQRIAILGTMNEMGAYSAKAHREAGEACDPAKLDLVVTIGADANEYLAPAAESRGCRVERFKSPYDAGASVKLQLKPGAAVLVKGSQNQVYAEEAIKLILNDPSDTATLVRQSEYWMQRKRAQFDIQS